MSAVKSRKITTTLFNVAAGSAADGTTYHYVSMMGSRKLGTQLEWTAGGAGGTITCTLEGSCQAASNSTTAASIEYDDITNATFGVANFTADFVAADNQEKLACYSWLRWKIIVANKDASTAYRMDVVRVG